MHVYSCVYTIKTMQIVRIISISTICIVFLLLLARNIFKKTDLKFKPFQELLCNLPDHDACRHADVQRVLCAELRYLKTSVGKVYHLLVYAFHLVAEHHGVAAVGVQLQVLQLRGAFHLLYRIDENALFLQFCHRLGSRLEVAPSHGVLASECRLVYLGVGWGSGDAAEVNGFYAESVGGTEHRTYVVERAHVVEHHDERQLVRLVKLVYRQTLHFYCSEFVHYSLSFLFF